MLSNVKVIEVRGSIDTVITIDGQEVAHNLSNQFLNYMTEQKFEIDGNGEVVRRERHIKHGSYVEVADYTKIDGVGVKRAAKMYEYGFRTWEDVLPHWVDCTEQEAGDIELSKLMRFGDMVLRDITDLESVPGVNKKLAATIQDYAEYVSMNYEKPDMLQKYVASDDYSELYREWLTREMKSDVGIISEQIQTLATYAENGHNIVITCPSSKDGQTLLDEIELEIKLTFETPEEWVRSTGGRNSGIMRQYDTDAYADMEHDFEIDETRIVNIKGNTKNMMAYMVDTDAVWTALVEGYGLVKLGRMNPGWGRDRNGKPFAFGSFFSKARKAKNAKMFTITGNIRRMPNQPFEILQDDMADMFKKFQDEQNDKDMMIVKQVPIYGMMTEAVGDKATEYFIPEDFGTEDDAEYQKMVEAIENDEKLAKIDTSRTFDAMVRWQFSVENVKTCKRITKDGRQFELTADNQLESAPTRSYMKQGRKLEMKQWQRVAA